MPYWAQEGCAKLTDDWGEDDENSSIRKSDTEGKTKGSN